MRFLVISSAPVLNENGNYVAYTPYVKELDMWLSHFDYNTIISPTLYPHKLLTSPFKNQNIKVKSVPSFSLISSQEIISLIFKIPVIIFRLFVEMQKADHIHLRLPGNMGLLGCVLQIFFPSKPKTAKYAGNWDPESKQPRSYRLQKWIVSNTFLTRNMKVLVYGEWENQSKNIIPFFTASYSQNEIFEVSDKDLSRDIRLIFVGTLGVNKRPMLAVQVAQELFRKGIPVMLEVYGEGSQRDEIQDYINTHHLEKIVFLKGNQNAETLKEAYQKAHFLLFASKSEGWPKVVAEAMLWKCLPVTTPVSCVPYMLGEGRRGSLVSPNVREMTGEVLFYINNHIDYKKKCNKAFNWAKIFTLELLDCNIKKIINN